MKSTPFTFSILFTLISFITPLHAETATQDIVTIEGREVLLKQDGSWQYRSEDRYASTKDGDRIHLKADGSWTIVGNAPLTSKEQVRTTELDIKLEKVVIEAYRKKTQKNTSLKTQTVFYLHLVYSPQSDQSLTINSTDIAFIDIKDNHGKSYKTLSIKPANTELKPDTKTTIVIRADKSPLLWDNAKSMEIILKTGILGLKAPVSLSQKTSDFAKENVAGFE